MDDESHSLGDNSGLNLESNEENGSDLVDSRLHPRLTQEPLLLDLPRDLVDETVFKSYTHAGKLVKKPILLVFGRCRIQTVSILLFHLARGFLLCPQLQVLQP